MVDGMSNAKIFGGMIFFAALLPLTACDLLADKVAGSCDWRPAKGDRCFEYTSVDAKKDCGGGRVWKDGPCDRASAVCGARLSVNNNQKWIYEAAGTTKEAAMTECKRDKLLGLDGKPAK